MNWLSSCISGLKAHRSERETAVTVMLVFSFLVMVNTLFR